MRSDLAFGILLAGIALAGMTAGVFIGLTLGVLL